MRSTGKKTANNKKVTFRPKQEMVGGSKKAAARKNRSQVFSPSTSKRSLRTITRPTRRNIRRPAKSRKHDTPQTYTDDSDNAEMAEEPHHQTMEPVARRTRSRKDPNYNYKRYLGRVLRKENANSKHSPLTISSKAMECMSNFMSDIFNKIADEAGKQVKKDKRKTLGDWDLKSAVQILMPGDLGKHANAMGYTKLQNMKKDKPVSKTNTTDTYFDPETGCVCPIRPKH